MVSELVAIALIGGIFLIAATIAGAVVNDRLSDDASNAVPVADVTSSPTPRRTKPNYWQRRAVNVESPERRLLAVVGVALGTQLRRNYARDGSGRPGTNPAISGSGGTPSDTRGGARLISNLGTPTILL